MLVTLARAGRVLGVGVAAAALSLGPIPRAEAHSSLSSRVIIDLGTAGGDAGSASALNDRGDVVGQTTTTAGVEQAFLWTPQGGLLALGMLPGTYGSRAIAVTYDRMVLGMSGPQTVVWTDSTGMVGIGPQGPYVGSVPVGADGAGDVVGNFSVRGSPGHLFFWSRPLGTTYYPRGLGPDGSAYFTAISESGFAVGWTPTAQGGTHAFIWSYGQPLRDLGVLPGELSSEALGVNIWGEAVGVSGSHAVAWDSLGHIRDLGLGRATSINQQGWILGTHRESNASDTLTLWLQNTTVKVPSACSSLQGADVRAYTRLNDDGILAATCTGWRDVSGITKGFQRSYVWSPEHRIRRLPTLPGRDSSVVDLNEPGQIVGTATTRSGSPTNSHPVLWTFHR